MTDTDIDIDVIDLDALRRAMEIYAAGDPAKAEQLRAKLQDAPWQDVAKFAAYCVQGDILQLRPWEPAPCEVEIDGTRPQDQGARRLLKRMLHAGISRWEPDPLRALDKVGRKR